MDCDSSFQCELKQYKNKIRNKLPFSNEVTKKLLTDLEIGIDDYISMNDVTSFDEIIEQFGSPLYVADELKNSTDTQVIKRKISIKRAVMVFMSVVIMLVGIGIVKITVDADTANATYGTLDFFENESIINDDISEVI